MKKIDIIIYIKQTKLIFLDNKNKYFARLIKI